MAEEKISAETTVMLTMQKLICAAEEAFDCFEDKDDDTFMDLDCLCNKCGICTILYRLCMYILEG